jgi:CheY-like chemotaxis protein
MSRPVILLIDDDDATLSVLRTKLSATYRLVTTTQPRDALGLAIQHKPDLILCDIDMPGHGGLAVAAEMAANAGTAAIQLIYLTGVVSPVQARDMDETIGGRPCVAKGGPLPLLLSRIESLLASRPAP